jgi:serine/threonine protein kinase
MSEAPPGSRVGTRFGRYHLKRLLGRGGMGEVYEAEDTVKDRVVALKLMNQEFSRDPVFRKRMQREAHIAGRLQEPHVVPIHDFGEIDGQLYLEMRMVDGTDLDSVLKRFGPLAPPRAVALIRQVAAALDAAHAAGVMHRDVKPQNILVTRDDFAYLVDFGIASATTDEKLTQLGTAVGTWKYMAPERFSNDEVTYRADIYALACVLHECLTGAPPYPADSASVLITAHMMHAIPKPSEQRPGVPKALDAVIARGMAKNPTDRYASAGDLALAAHEALSSPDQDRAATLLEHSQHATSPAGEATVNLSSAGAGPQQTWGTTSSTPPPQPVPQSGWGQSSSTPPPHQGWGQSPSTPPPQPIAQAGWNQSSTPPPQPFSQPGWGQSSSTPPPQPISQQGWNQGSATPPPQFPWNQNQPPPRKGMSGGTKVILGAAALAVVIIVVVVVAVFVVPSPPPPLPILTADQMDSLLLNAGEVNTVMGASNMQSGQVFTTAGDPTFTLSNQDCLGALFAGEGPTYEDSDFDKLHYMTVLEPSDKNDHFVDEDVALFKTADQAQAFVKSQATKWKNCATETVTVTHRDNSTSEWHIGNVSGEPPKISQLDNQRNTKGWKCQRALNVLSNVVLDVNACGYNVSDEGVQTIEKMAAKFPK